MILTYIVVIILITLSALFSGLTLGLMGLDVYDMERKMRDGNKYAKKIFPLRVRGNLLLTSLLLGNVFVNAVLSVFLGSIAGGVVAGITATALIFIFGEIIPQATIPRYALRFGAATVPLVRGLIFILYPIVYPISLLLDKLLGKEAPNVYSHNELISIIAEHEDSKNSPLDADEERIVLGALKFSNKKINKTMTPRTVVVGVLKNEKITQELIDKLVNSGFSRFPVYENETREKVVGLLPIRSLIGIEMKGAVSDINLLEVHMVDEQMPLDDVLNKFIKTHMQMFAVQDEFGSFAGIITVEDILEEIIQCEIIDENDKHHNMRKLARDKKNGENKEK